MAFTQADLDALDKAIALGALEVEIDQGGVRQKTRFDSFEALLRRRDFVASQLAGANAPTRMAVTAHSRD